VYKVNQSWGPWILTSLLRLISFGCKLWCQCWLGLNLKVQCTVGVARGHHITGGFAEWHEVTWSDMKWHERTWHFTSVHKFRVFFCSVYRFHGLPEFTRWFSLSKPPVSREESDFLVRRVLLIWKRAMRQFFGRVEDLSESSILSYFLSLFINASPKLAMSWECVQWCPNSPSIFVCFCFRIQRWTELRNFCFVASQLSVSELVSLRRLYKHPWDLPWSERSVEKIGSDTTFSSSCCSSSWAKRPMYNAARHPPGKMSQADMA